jgi:hypothetical protein
MQCRRGRLDAILIQHQIQAASITFSMGESDADQQDCATAKNVPMVLIICAHGTSLPPYVKNLHANMHVSRGSQEKLSETYQSRGRNQYAETSPGDHAVAAAEPQSRPFDAAG